ncbi:MAG TPA: MarR family transcriptional regulator [Burkholderiaceae bacterium]
MRFSKIGYQDEGGTAAAAAEDPGIAQHPSLELWHRMRACIARIDGEITARMREQFGISMPQFEVLKQLRKFPDGLRMGELAQLLKVSGASITSFTDQLELAELVLRIPDRVDRRVNSVRLTNPGRQLLVKAMLEYERWVVELMDDAALEAGAVTQVDTADTVAELPARNNVHGEGHGKTAAHA